MVDSVGIYTQPRAPATSCAIQKYDILQVLYSTEYVMPNLKYFEIFEYSMKHHKDLVNYSYLSSCNIFSFLLVYL